MRSGLANHEAPLVLSDLSETDTIRAVIRWKGVSSAARNLVMRALEKIRWGKYHVDLALPKPKMPE